MTTQIDLLAALPVAVYTTDIEGRITFYNDAAAELWGHRPELGDTRWCGSWRLYWPDGRPMVHDECPMAVALREGREVRGVDAISERPDGTRVLFQPFPTPLKDAAGKVVGGINLLVDVSERRRGEIESANLAAIVASSDDAIVGKTLDGRVTSWNGAAARIFGYEPEEMIGESIRRIIPQELQQEEEVILGRLKRGERIEHFDTVRVAKDGRRLAISLTVSPIRDRSGKVVGASKVARDITERKRSEELQRLLFDELNHRVKNTLAMVQAIASQSLGRGPSPNDFASGFTGRIRALARAHDLLVRRELRGADIIEIIQEQVLLGGPRGSRVSTSGPLLFVDSQVAVQLALVLHELATNARKFGALSIPSGQLAIAWRVHGSPAGRELLLEWRETGVPNLTAPSSSGFGTVMIERTLESHGGEATIRYNADGLVCEMRLPLASEDRNILGGVMTQNDGDNPGSAALHREPQLRGKRILVVEDEAIIAMEVESELVAAGCQVVGPVANLKNALLLLEKEPCDAALLDANLAGRPVEELAAALARKDIPFAFATGYGPEALPVEFRDRAILGKPFDADQLLKVVRALVNHEKPAADVVPLRPKRA